MVMDVCKMDATAMTDIHNILTSLYPEVTTLDNYFSTVDKMITDGDSERYRTLLTTTLVAVLPDSKPFPTSASRSFLFRQHEIVNRAVCHIAAKHGLGKHILTLGYRQLSENPHTRVSSCLDGLESTCPNWNVAALQSPTWEKLLSRIGNELMIHLIENTALFIAAEKCYIQISGIPVVNLVPSVQLKIQPSRKRKCSDSDKKQTRKSCVNYCTSAKNPNPPTVKSNAQNVEKVRPDTVNDTTDLRPPVTEGLKSNNSCRTEVLENPLLLTSKTECLEVCLSSETTETHQNRQKKNVRKRRRKKRHKRLNNGEDLKETGAPYKHGLCADRRSLFYAKDLREQLPKIRLFRLEPTAEGAMVLFDEMFTDCDVGETVPFTDSEKDILKENVGDLFLKLISNHNKCPYRYLLAYYSGLSKDKTTSTTENVSGSGMEDCRKDTTGMEFNSRRVQNVKLGNIIPESKRGMKRKKLIDLEERSGEARASNPERSSVPVYKRGEKRKGEILDLEKKSRKALKKPKISEKELLQEKLCHSDMFRFLRNIIRRVVPQELFGSSLNGFMAELCVFVNLGRYERFCLGRLMKRVKDKPCKWLSGINRPLLRRHWMAHFIWWLLTHFVIPVVKGFFYVTDSAAQRNRTLYFRKKTWLRLRQRTVAGYEATGMLERRSKDEVEKQILEGQSLGVSTLRFIPKTSSLRPIVNMGKTTLGKKEQSINKKLQNLYTVLADCQEQHPEAFGSSVFGLDEVHQKWQSFLQLRIENNDARPLFFVKVDIAKCFDSIKPRIVLDAVRELLESNDETYVIRRWASVKLSGNSLKRNFHRIATAASKYVPNFRAYINQHLKESTCAPAIVSDQVFYHYENSKSLMKKLEAHLFGNVIQIGRQFYLQKIGISQGSVVSTQLCNLYYAHMERNILSENICSEDDCSCNETTENPPNTDTQEQPYRTRVCRDGELLMRMVDDFLFVTPYLSHAQQFLWLLVRGVPEYNCRVNADKMLVNFDSPTPSIERVLDDGWLPWCGIQIHTETLHIQTDYGRYKGISVRDTMTFDLVQNPGQTLQQKLYKTVCAQCHAVCFDAMINSVEVVSNNLYRLFLLAAYKFHANARILPRSPNLNPQFFLSTIRHLPSLVLNQIETKLQATDNCPVLQHESITWLCIGAFLTKLQKHQGGYQNIIKGLGRVRRRLQIDEVALATLKNTIKVGIPQEFTQIMD